MYVCVCLKLKDKEETWKNGMDGSTFHREGERERERTSILEWILECSLALSRTSRERVSTQRKKRGPTERRKRQLFKVHGIEIGMPCQISRDIRMHSLENCVPITIKPTITLANSPSSSLLHVGRALLFPHFSLSHLLSFYSSSSLLSSSLSNVASSPPGSPLLSSSLLLWLTASSLEQGDECKIHACNWKRT